MAVRTILRESHSKILVSKQRHYLVICLGLIYSACIGRTLQVSNPQIRLLATLCQLRASVAATGCFFPWLFSPRPYNNSWMEPEGRRKGPSRTGNRTTRNRTERIHGDCCKQSDEDARTTNDPPRVAHERLAFQNGETGNVRQLHADAGPWRGAVPRHHRLRRHRRTGDQPGADRPARYALPGREGPGQEPADAVAVPLSGRRGPLSRHPRLPGARGPLPPDHFDGQAHVGRNS